MANFVTRVLRAAKLDSLIYEEIEADAGATWQAFGVVLLSSLAAGLGNMGQGGLVGLISVAVAALLSWYIWSYLTYFIGAKFLPEPQTRTRPGELLRTIGFASAPGLVRVLGIVPGLTGIVFTLAAIWMFIAMIVAVRQALDYTRTARAVGVCAIGWVVQAVILLPVLLLFGVTPELS